jgi:pyruvate kinase
VRIGCTFAATLNLAQVLPLSDGEFLTHLAPGDLVHVARYLASGMERASLFLEVQEVTPGEHARCRALTPAVLDGLITIARAAPAGDCAPAPRESFAGGGGGGGAARASSVSQHDASFSGSDCGSPSAHTAPAAVAADAAQRVPPPSCLCAEDRELLCAFAGKAVDFVALSYAETGAQVIEARAYLASLGMQETAILAKVETRAALRNFEGILAEADGIIISRGNLGMAVPIEKVARLQKEMVRGAAWLARERSACSDDGRCGFARAGVALQRGGQAVRHHAHL